MEYELRLKGRPPFPLKSWGNLAVETAASLAGVKPVIQAWILEPDLDYAAALCRALGWKSLVHERQESGPPPARVGLMLGKNLKLLKAAARAWEKPHSNPGPELGYPRCCNRFYWEWDPAKSAGSDMDIIHRARANTPRPDAPLPFLLNDCFYLFSRRWVAADADKRDKIAQRNPGLDLNVLNAVPWHPCSYRCAASLARAKKTLKFMKASVPPLAKLLETHLKGPVLFWNWDRFAALDAVPKGPGRWLVKGLRPPYSLLEPALEGLFAGGGELTRSGKAWTLSRSGKKLWSGKPDAPFLLDFR